MNKLITLLALGTLIGLSACKGQAQQTDTSVAPSVAVKPINYRFASLEEAGDILTTMDSHFGNMQTTEMGVRLSDPNDPTLAKLSAQYKSEVVPWTEDEKAFLMEMVEDSRPALTSMRQHIPDEVLLAQISDKIEGGLPHTRGNLILFSADMFDGFMATRKSDPAKAEKELTKLFLHELHHVLTRANQDKMDAYFALIGFKPCAFVEPAKMREMRLTNPDAPEYGHYAPVSVQGTDGLIPYLSVTGAYNPDIGGSLGSHMDFGLLRVSVKDGRCEAADVTPQFISPVPDFMDLIGKNTGYIIHPEETLADNFVHYVMKTKGLPNPEIPAAVGAFWSKP